MPSVSFTNNLQRHVTCPRVDVTADTVRDVLTAVFAENPDLEGYILDDQGCLRKHMSIFVDGVMIVDRAQMGDRVKENSAIYILQALSGG